MISANEFITMFKEERALIAKAEEQQRREPCVSIWPPPSLPQQADAQQAQSKCPDPDGCLREGCNQTGDGSLCERYYEAVLQAEDHEFNVWFQKLPEEQKTNKQQMRVGWMARARLKGNS